MSSTENIYTILLHFPKPGISKTKTMVATTTSTGNLIKIYILQLKLQCAFQKHTSLVHLVEGM